MKTNLPGLKYAGEPALLAICRNTSFKSLFRRWWMVMLLALLGIATFAQNAIVGAGFAPGWGGACGTNTNFEYFSPGAGGSWIRTTKANGAGNQYFRLGVDWDGQLRQHTITIGSDVKVEPGTEYTLNNTCTTSGAMFIDVANADHNYVFKTFNAGTNPQYRMVYFKVEGDIRTISNVGVPANVYAGAPASISATTSGNLAPGQGVYLRYTTDAFATSTVVAMTGAGTDYTAQIPALPLGTEVKYYCFTSGSGLTIPHANADFFAINLNGNNGLNFGYTVQAQPAFQTIANGNWNNAATWDGGNIPNSPTAVVNIKHNVTVNGEYSVKDITIDADKVLSIANVLTVADGGTVNNIGKLATMGKLKFAGAGTIVNKNPDHLFDVELNGLVQLSGCSIKSTLEIKANGGVAAGPGPVIWGTLYVNTGGAYSRGNEWTTEHFVGNVKIGPGTTYTLCDASPTAAYATSMDVIVETTGTFILDPLCGGNAGAAAGPLVQVNMLTIGGNLNIQGTGAFEMQRGDVGSLLEGTRFNLVVNGNVVNNGTLRLNDDIGDDLVLKGNWTNNGTFNPGSNSSAGANPVTDKDGRAVLFNGTTPQAINGNLTNFHYLIVNNPAGITANTPVLVSRGLGLIAGKVNLNGQTITLGTYYTNENNGISYTLGRLYSSSTASYTFGGSFLRLISKQNQPSDDDEQVAPNLGEPYVFPVGTPDDYRPYAVTWSAYPAVETSLTVRHYGGAGIVTGAQPNLTDADGVNITQHYADAYWDVLSRTSENGTFDVSYSCNNCNIGVSNPDKIRSIRRSNGAGEWSAPGGIIPTTGTNASPTVGRSGLTGFSQFGIGFDPVVLPVRLKTFTGTRTTSGNLLSWVSSSEVNFSHYALQRSADSRNWNDIARISGTGGNFDKSYSHTDQKATGLNYYRLHMVDKDGSSRYSPIVTLKGNEPVTGSITAVYQPGTQRIMLQHNGDGFAQGSTARVADINGRVLTQRKLEATSLQYLSTGYLPAGVYLVQVAATTGIETIKVMVR